MTNGIINWISYCGKFSVFNELSLPLKQHQIIKQFTGFFTLLAAIKKKGLNQIRMNDDFKHYSILEGISFQQFLGQQIDRDFQSRLRSFVTNTVIAIDTPIIKNEELKQSEQQGRCEYHYHQKKTEGGLACCDIWNTLAVSFNLSEEWDKAHIILKKIELVNDEIIEHDTRIKHASNIEHLSHHQALFDRIESEKKLDISPGNFWQNRMESFFEVIVFCPEVEGQIQKLDKIIFQHAMSILRDVETKRKLVTDFNFSGEGETVCNDPKHRSIRTFTIEGEKVFFQNHIKSLPNGYRIYYFQKNKKIYIGSIGNHFSTAKHK